MKAEREEEIAYLQAQLEILSSEKHTLRETVIDLESRLNTHLQMETKYSAKLTVQPFKFPSLKREQERQEELQDEIEELRGIIAGLNAKVEASQSLNDTIEDLRHQLALKESIKKQPPSISPGALLSQLKCRIDVLASPILFVFISLCTGAN